MEDRQKKCVVFLADYIQVPTKVSGQSNCLWIRPSMLRTSRGKMEKIKDPTASISTLKGARATMHILLFVRIIMANLGRLILEAYS